MADLPEVGPWAKEKLEALARYLDFYTKVLKNQRWRTIYLEAYAGGGRAVVRVEERADVGGGGLFGDEPPIDAEARELIDGSPRVALGIVNPFDRYVFADRDPDRAAELEALKWEFEGSRTIQRMLPNSGEVPEGWAATLDSLFGTRPWFEEVYKRREGGLFAVRGFEKRPDYSERLLDLYRGRLRSAFGHVSTPRLIRNTRRAPLYYLVWAGPNKKGLEGTDYILTMGERLSRQGDRATK